MHEFSFTTITNKETARAVAIVFQQWAGKSKLPWSELLKYQADFTRLAHKYGLVREFRENGIV